MRPPSIDGGEYQREDDELQQMLASMRPPSIDGGEFIEYLRPATIIGLQ